MKVRMSQFDLVKKRNIKLLEMAPGAAVTWSVRNSQLMIHLGKIRNIFTNKLEFKHSVTKILAG